ncbi:MAG: carbohydrate ABC transporter permease [Defluviitaleaceae bacterium]|nr:carbohydrate ABC transporter permease [Defluviitaleaceae bacterium]
MTAIKNNRLFSDPAYRRQVTIRIRAVLFGASREKRGLVSSILLYFTLTSLALVYFAPILSMFVTSVMIFSDMMNPATNWIPRQFEWSNFYPAAWNALSITPGTWFVPGFTFLQNIGRSTMVNTVVVTLPSALFQVFSCAVAGYAFGRLDFPFKRAAFVLLILVFVVPPQAQLIPLIWTYRGLGILNTPLVFYGPAFFGHGVRGSLFVFVYMQFFRKLPKDLEEAAMVDGVSPLMIFIKVMMPLAKPAFMVVFLFSIVYHWTESLLSSTLYSQFPTLSVRIMMTMDPDAMTGVHVTMRTVQMATGVIMMAPILLLYFFTQRTFTESIERTGLVD